MAPKEDSQDKDLAYLIAVMKHATEFKVDYGTLAQDTSIKTANYAQKKFRAIVEKSGQYKLVNGKVVDNDDLNTTATVPIISLRDDNGDDVTVVTKKRKVKAI